MKLFGAGVTLEVRLGRIIFFRHYLMVHFRLPGKKVCLRFEIIWCRGVVGGNARRKDFLQALPSSALWFAWEESMSQV